MFFNEQVTFNQPIRINAGIERSSQNFAPGDVTPNVKNHSYWICANSVSVTITQFDQGQDCQELNILGDGFTTIANNSNIKTNEGADKLLAVNTVYRFINYSNVWYESEDKNAGGGGGAPTNAQYLVLVGNASLSAERILAFGADFTTVDGGANGNFTVNLSDVVAAGTYTKLTVSAKGRVTTGTTLIAGDIPNLDAAKITSGAFDVLRIPNLDAAKITTGAFDAARIPNLDASKITTGTIDQARIPTTLDANARVAVRKDSGAVVGTRRRINFITGTNVTLTITDDAGNEEIDVTIDAAAGSSSKMLVPISMGNRVWTNMTNAARGSALPLFNVLMGSGAALDLQALNPSEFRLHVVVEVAGATSATLFARFSNDPAFVTGINDLQSTGTTGDVTVTSTGYKTGTWVTVHNSAKIATCFLKVYGFGSNGTADPVFPYVAVEFR